MHIITIEKGAAGKFNVLLNGPGRDDGRADQPKLATA